MRLNYKISVKVDSFIWDFRGLGLALPIVSGDLLGQPTGCSFGTVRSGECAATGSTTVVILFIIAAALMR